MISFALATADRDHRVDRLDAGEHRLGDRLTLDDARSLELGRDGVSDVSTGPLPVERVAERIDDPAEQGVARPGTSEQAAGALDRVAFRDVLPFGPNSTAPTLSDSRFEREAGHAVGQIEHLERHAVLQPVDAGDAVGHRQHRADLGQLGAGRCQDPRCGS